MKQVKFISVDIEGFGAIQKPFHFDFDNPGINVIRGMNGTSKTTVFNAPFWCLYGLNLKGVTKDRISTWPHVRTPEYRGTRVITTYETEGQEYQVARHVGFKGKTGDYTGGDTMMVFVDGEMKSTGINDSTKLVEDSLGLNAKMFLNSVLFGQRMKKLIEADDEEKRKVFEELFNAEWVAQTRVKAVNKANELKGEIMEQSNTLVIAQGKLSSYQEMVASLENARDNFEEVKGQTITENKYYITETLEKIEIVKQTLADGFHDTSEEKLQESLSVLEDCEINIARLGEEISILTQEISKLTTSHAVTDREKNNLQQRLYDYTLDAQNFEQDKEADIERIGQEISIIRLALEDDSLQISKTDRELTVLRNDGVDLSIEDKIAQITPRIDSLGVDINRLNKRIYDLDNEWQAKDKELKTLQDALEQNTCFNCGKPLDDIRSTIETITVIQERLVKIKSDMREGGELKETITKELQTLKTSLDGLKELLPHVQKFKELEASLQIFTQGKAKRMEKLNLLQQQGGHAKTKVWEKPPPCTDEDITNRDKELVRLSAQINELELNKSELSESLNAYRGVKIEAMVEVEAMRTDIKRKDTLTHDLQQLRDKVEGLEGEIETLNTSEFTMGDKLKESKRLGEEVLVNISTISHALEVKNQELSNYQYWVDALGANGVKAFIFEAMLQLLNAAMETYAQQLGVRVRFTMSMDTARKGIITQCYKDGGIVLYDELSGGEKQRVDIVQVFGTHDVVSGKVGFNILLMDEVFENLDTEGVDAVFDLVRMKMVEDRSIYIITHQKEINTMYAKVINFSREGANLTIS